MNRISVLLIVACLSLSTASLGVAADDTIDIPANAQATGDHDSLVAALAHVGLVETLQGEGPFTVFAPTDAAFAAAEIDLSTFDTDAENETLKDILLYHVVAGAVDAANVSDGMSATMVNGDNATFTVTNGTVMINGATVTGKDVFASNGIIHVIDKVLTPPADEETPTGPPGVICYNLITHTIVVEATQAECEAYMYVENYEINGQNITGCYNMVTHAVSNVTQQICESYMWAPAVTLAMTASATTIHTSLVAALAAADLTATLSGADNYTVFAPTDEAFAAAGIDLDSYDTPEEIAALSDILLYHVLAGTVLSTDIADGMSTVTAANGDNLSIHSTSDGVMVGTAMANVTIANVPASNGVIHVIDQVLFPPADETTEESAVVDPFEGVTCTVTIGVGSSGLAYYPASTTINVGDTVCWSWEGGMEHNVRQVDGDKSTTYVTNGVTSGAPATTVNFHHTFTEDTTFYYACEPHIGSNMFGKIVVGDGGEVATGDDKADKTEATPGFMGITALIAFVAAIAFVGRKNHEE
tara:strand:- start:434 stop:2023 length:1590 start_codon:yes stop_codon:yes gene_type:complete